MFTGNCTDTLLLSPCFRLAFALLVLSISRRGVIKDDTMVRGNIYPTVELEKHKPSGKRSRPIARIEHRRPPIDFIEILRRSDPRACLYANLAIPAAKKPSLLFLYLPSLFRSLGIRSIEIIGGIKRAISTRCDRVVFRRLNLQWFRCGCFLRVYSRPVFRGTFRASCLDTSRGTKDASLLVT